MYSFFSKTRSSETGCLLWTASISAYGYGCFWFDGKSMQAHRVAWIIEHGDIPDGMHVLHTCDVRDCVNIDHLFLGTHADNMADMAAKGRHSDVKGEKNATAVLTKQDVLDIRASNLPNSTLASMYGMSYQGIWRIVARKTWRHV